MRSRTSLPSQRGKVAPTMSDSRLGSASLASALLSGQQDVAEWCNAVVASHGDESSSLDAHVSAVSMKLQILAADLNDELEASMAELLAAPASTAHGRQPAMRRGACSQARHHHHSRQAWQGRPLEFPR